MAITAPLNAIFTPAPKCLQDNFYDTSAENPDFIGTSGNDTVVIRGIQPQCYPISFASIAQAAIQEVTETDDYGKTQTATSTANLGSSTHGRVLELSKVQSPEWMPYYSPGPCPLGYGTAAHTVMTEGVTAATCCPVTWTNDNGKSSKVSYSLTTHESFRNMCYGGQGETVTIQTAGQNATTTAKTRFFYPITVRYKDSETSIWATETPAPKTWDHPRVRPSLTLPLTGQTGQSSVEDAAGERHAHTSTGPQVGAAVGVFVGTLLLLAACAVLYRKHTLERVRVEGVATAESVDASDDEQDATTDPEKDARC